MKTVTEIARQFSVSAETIRHYTKLGLLSPKRDATNGYRLYDLPQERRLRFLLGAKRLGFTLREIQTILEVASTGDSPCPLVRQLIDERLETTRAEMRDAQMLMARMESASNEWHELPNRDPSGESICHLIETWDSTNSNDDPAISGAE